MGFKIDFLLEIFGSKSQTVGGLFLLKLVQNHERWATVYCSKLQSAGDLFCFKTPVGRKPYFENFVQKSKTMIGHFLMKCDQFTEDFFHSNSPCLVRTLL